MVKGLSFELYWKVLYLMVYGDFVGNYQSFKERIESYIDFNTDQIDR